MLKRDTRRQANAKVAEMATTPVYATAPMKNEWMFTALNPLAHAVERMMSTADGPQTKKSFLPTVQKKLSAAHHMHDELR
jgi:hypothetical protein